MKKNLVKLSAASLGTLHCINKYIDSRVTNVTSKSSGKYYHWKNGDIFYREYGKGEPILLLHDLNVFSSENDWIRIISKLSLTNHVFVPDLAGCGRSDKPSVTYTNYFYVQMISDFIRNIIKERTIVAASGLTTTCVLMANSLDEHLFKNILLINPPALSSMKKLPDHRSKVIIRLFGLPVIGKTCYYIAVNKENTEDYFSEKIYFNPFHVKHQTIKEGYQAAHYGNGNGRYLFASIEGGYLNVDPTNAIKKSNQQIVLLISEYYPGAEDIAANYRSLNESIIVRTIHDTKKLPELEAPEKVADIIKEVI